MIPGRLSGLVWHSNRYTYNMDRRQNQVQDSVLCTCPLEPFNHPPVGRDIRLLRACLRGTAPPNSTVRHGCTFCCALQAAQTGSRCSAKGRLVRRAQWLPLLTRPRRCSPAFQASISSPSPLMMGMHIAQWLPSPAFANPTTTRAQTSVSRGGGRHKGLPRLQCDGSIVTPQNNEALDNQVIR